MLKTTERVKKVGNVISEYDNYTKLYEISPRTCKDTLRGFFGEKHGDWEKANTEAEISMQLLEAMSKREINFKETYKATKRLTKEKNENRNRHSPSQLLA